MYPRYAVCVSYAFNFQCRCMKNGRTTHAHAHGSRGRGRTDGRRQSQCQRTRSPLPQPPQREREREREEERERERERRGEAREGGGDDARMRQLVARPRPSAAPSSCHRRTIPPPSFSPSVRLSPPRTTTVTPMRGSEFLSDSSICVSSEGGQEG